MHLGRAQKQGGSAKRTDDDVCRASRAAAGYKSHPYSSQRIFDWHHDAQEVAGFAEAEEEAGESLVPYHLRHSALTRLAENYLNLYAIAAAAGHSSVTITFRYFHPQKREIWVAFEKRVGTLSGKPPESRISKSLEVTVKITDKLLMKLAERVGFEPT